MVFLTPTHTHIPTHTLSLYLSLHLFFLFPLLACPPIRLSHLVTLFSGACLESNILVCPGMQYGKGVGRRSRGICSHYPRRGQSSRPGTSYDVSFYHLFTHFYKTKNTRFYAKPSSGHYQLLCPITPISVCSDSRELNWYSGVYYVRSVPSPHSQEWTVIPETKDMEERCWR